MESIKIVLVGAESSGKTTLCRALAAHFDTVFVDEYGRLYCERFGNDCDALDHCHIAAGQVYLEDIAEPRHGILFCDTDLLLTQTFAELYTGSCPPMIPALAATRHYDLWLLLTPDLPFQQDAIRLFEDRRTAHFQRIEVLLQERGYPYKIIAGEDRFDQAVRAVEALLSER